MRASVAMAGTAALIMAAGAWAPAVAAPVGFSVHIVAHTEFEGAQRLRVQHPRVHDRHGGERGECRSPLHSVGRRVRRRQGVHVHRRGAGFVLRLRASFGEGGSTGSWTVASGSGDLDGLKGSGSLVGIPTEVGIDDVYTGTVR